MVAIPHLDVAFHTEDHDGGRARLVALWSTLAAGGPPDIMYFRLFENAAGTARFVRAWRTLGNVYLLRSSDQVTAEELEAAVATGSVASMFIATPALLEASLADACVGRDELPPAPQAYPQRALLCHGNFWKTAVELLLQRMDLVMVDLTGFGLENTGTAYELQRVIDTFPIERVTLLVDRTSDQPFLAPRSVRRGRAWRRAHRTPAGAHGQCTSSWRTSERHGAAALASAGSDHDGGRCGRNGDHSRPASHAAARRGDACASQASWITSASSCRVISPSRQARTSTDGWPSKCGVVKNGESGSWTIASLSSFDSTQNTITSS